MISRQAMAGSGGLGLGSSETLGVGGTPSVGRASVASAPKLCVTVETGPS